MIRAPFEDRRHAGRDLAQRLSRFAHRPDVTVLALPRGGVPVAAELATALDAPLDVFVVRKLGVPGRPELAMGAIASGGARVLNEDVVSALEIHSETVDAVTADETEELARREQAYRDDRPPIDVRGRTVLLVDDGAATGASMRVAAEALRQLHPARIVAVLPVASRDACDRIHRVCDAVVCAEMPEPFRAVAVWYDHFPQVEDEEVLAALAQAHAAREGAA
jgi:putative phosphoribosyl transferase